MSLSAGTRLGSYEVIAAIGAGGMGEVYRARDTKLNRDVALKILPETFATDPDRLARLKREAQLLASLNHPNIAAIYGFEDADATHALVLELVEGPTLAERIEALRAEGKRLPLDEALLMAKQIADALEAAHEQGIIHRDLKPANIKVRRDGTVKVLDFGLAKAFDPGPSSNLTLTNSPTLSIQATYAGVILGTAAYMSPEQASGKAVDKRADIWSFGVVLWEMLTGARLFDAETISHTLADVLRASVDFSQLPRDTPPVIRDLLRRCLDRDVRRRLRDIGEARVSIERAMADPQMGAMAPAGDQSTAGHRPWWRRAVPLLVSATLGAALSGFVTLGVRTPPASAPTVTRFTFRLPEGQQFWPGDRHLVDVSPDGTELVYAASQRLYRKPMWELDSTPIAGSENPLGTQAPVFSSDGRWIAFLGGTPAGAAIQKIPRTGGTAVTLATIGTNPFGISWSAGGVLVGMGVRGIQRVSETGGMPEQLFGVKDGEAEAFPQMLPGGDAVLYTRGSTDLLANDAEIVVRSLKSGNEKTVIKAGGNPRYAPTGHIVYAVGGVLFAVPFDLKKLEITGDPVQVVEGIRRGTFGVGGAAQFSVSNNGVLAYVPGPALASERQRDVAIIDRNGKIEPLKLPAGLYEAPRVSPNGKQLAAASLDGKEFIIWIYDLSGTTSIRRLTFGGRSRFPIWSPDGARVAFQSDRDGDLAVFSQRADGTGPAERLTKPGPDASHVPDAWSPGGDRILFSETRGGDVSSWTVTLQDKKVAPFGDIRSSLPIDAAFSPDGKWVAYQSGKTGANAVYVQPFPATGAKYQISNGNAHHPVWSRDGKEIVYIPAQSLPVVASVRTQPSLVVGNTPVRLPAWGNEGGPATIRNYDILPDGRLVGVVNAGQPLSGTPVTQQINVVVNWFEELKQRVPVR